ncbi:hypothetical protein [Methylobacterium sp. 1030]|uniref:hypothetical protein n=1 Tax=Methylobacterium sp. 1030 TaxID=3156404 RepID=UPI0033909474
MSSLSSDQLKSMVEAMENHEGYSEADHSTVLNIGDPINGYRSNFDPNDPAVGDINNNGVGTGQKTETESTNLASFTINNDTEKTYNIGNSSAELQGNNVHVYANNIELDVDPSGSAFISGAGDKIVLQPNSNTYAAVTGSNQSVSGDNANNVVNLGGEGTSATVSGGGYVGLTANNETVTLTDTGSTVQTAGGVQNDVVNANGSTITLAANSLANISGSSDTINLQANSNETIGITGQGLTVAGDSGDDVVNLNANTSATVSGGGRIGLVGNDAALTTNPNESFTITCLAGVTTGTINASNSTINLAPGWSGTINGQNNMINGGTASGASPTPAAGGDTSSGGSSTPAAGGDTSSGGSSTPAAGGDTSSGGTTPGSGDASSGGSTSDGGSDGGSGEEYSTMSLRNDEAPDRQPSSARHKLGLVASPATDSHQSNTISQAIQLTSAIAGFSPASGSDTGQGSN